MFMQLLDGVATVSGHNEAMRGRRFWLWVLLLVLIAALAATIAPREEPSRKGVNTVVAGPPARTVTGKLPATRPITATVGDVVDVSVTVREADEAQIEPLAVQAPAEPGIPAQLEFVADTPGRFPVTLRDSGRRVGTVIVRPAA
jgi:hypothetical protein